MPAFAGLSVLNATGSVVCAGMLLTQASLPVSNRSALSPRRNSRTRKEANHAWLEPSCAVWMRLKASVQSDVPVYSFVLDPGPIAGGHGDPSLCEKTGAAL